MGKHAVAEDDACLMHRAPGCAGYSSPYGLKKIRNIEKKIDGTMCLSCATGLPVAINPVCRVFQVPEAQPIFGA